MAVNRVEVTINSRQYAVLAEESVEYIEKLAAHIDEKVSLVLKGGQNVLGERPLVLAALNICDEYYKCEVAGRVLQKQLAACTEKLNRAHDDIKALKAATPQISLEEQETEEKLRDTENELRHTQDELRLAQDKIQSLETKLDELERRNKNVSRNNYGRRN